MIIIENLESAKIVYDKKIKFKNGTDLKRHGKIKNLPNEQLRFEYYMNSILSIEETILGGEIMINYYQGTVFNTPAKTIVNTVN